MPYTNILVEIEDGVSIVTLNRPEVSKPSRQSRFGKVALPTAESEASPPTGGARTRTKWSQAE